MIALLCPTRGRPEQFKRMCESAWLASKSGIKIFAYGSSEDKITYGIKGCIHDEYVEFIDDIDYPTVFKWNYLADYALHFSEIKLFMLAADDMIFATPCWDEALINHYNSLENKIHVYALQDSRDPEGTPHPIVTREYIDAMGYFMPPIFFHWFADTWTVDIARANGCFTHLKDYLLIHDKTSDKGQPDETHNRIRRMGWHERDKAVNDSCQHYLMLEKARLESKINKEPLFITPCFPFRKPS